MKPLISRMACVLLLCLVGTTFAQEVNGAPSPLSDTGYLNKVWVSVQDTDYEIAVQVEDPSVGWRTLFTRDHNTPRNQHPFDFYNLGQNRFRVLLSKRNGVYVNLECGNVIDFRSSIKKMTERVCP